MADSSIRRYSFGRFEMRAAERLLLDGPNAVPIGGRALDLLPALVESGSHLASPAELHNQLMPCGLL